jgi:hypothetical protein
MKMLESIELLWKHEIWTDMCIEDDLLNSKDIIILATISAVSVSWMPYILYYLHPPSVPPKHHFFLSFLPFLPVLTQAGI